MSVCLRGCTSSNMFQIATATVFVRFSQNLHTSMVDSAKVLYPLRGEIAILIPGDGPSIFPSLEKMWNFNSL